MAVSSSSAEGSRRPLIDVVEFPEFVVEVRLSLLSSPLSPVIPPSFLLYLSPTFIICKTSINVILALALKLFVSSCLGDFFVGVFFSVEILPLFGTFLPFSFIAVFFLFYHYTLCNYRSRRRLVRNLSSPHSRRRRQSVEVRSPLQGLLITSSPLIFRPFSLIFSYIS